MRVFKALSSVITQKMDKVAGFVLCGLIVLIVINVILRLLGAPIAGTYELTSLFTAIVIGFSLAYCAFNNGHISVTLLIEKLPSRISRMLTYILNSIAVIFWTFVSFRIFVYAAGAAARNEISPLLKMPKHLFVYAVAIGFLMLPIVLVNKFSESGKDGKK